MIPACDVSRRFEVGWRSYGIGGRRGYNSQGGSACLTKPQRKIERVDSMRSVVPGPESSRFGPDVAAERFGLFLMKPGGKLRWRLDREWLNSTDQNLEFKP